MHYLPLLLLKKKRFKFLSSICNGWHDIIMMSIDINSIAMLNIDGAAYRLWFLVLVRVKL